MSKSIYKILVFTLLFTTKLAAQDEIILARVGENVITAKEFLARYELTPQLYRENKKIVSELKTEFLYSMIAEKLLAQYGIEIKLDTSEVVNKTLKNFEEMFVRDALYKKVIREKAKSKADSLLSFYLDYANNVQIVFISSKDEQEINNINKLIKIGVPFDSLYTEFAISINDTLTISLGQLDEKIEDQLFPLPNGATTDPIKMDGDWYIFKILRRFNPTIFKMHGWESQYKNSERLATERAEYDFYNNYISTFFKGKEMSVNAKLLRYLASLIYPQLSYIKENANVKPPYTLSGLDIAKIIDKISIDSLKLSIVQLDGKYFTLNEFISFLRFDYLNIDTLTSKSINNALGFKLRKYVEYKLLSEEGYKLGLQNLLEVKKQVQSWRDNYYMQLVTSTFIDSAEITETDLANYYANDRNYFSQKKVNLFKFYSDSLSKIEKLLSEIQSGKDFIEQAKNYSLGSEDNTTSLETGFISITADDETSMLVNKMQVGDIYGPILTNNRYLVFKLIGVEQDSVTFLANNNSNMELKRELSYLKKKQSYNNFISNLATKYGLKVFTENLNNIQVTSQQSFAYQYLGFGGRILAVPLLNINMEWVSEWKNKINNLQ
jgi:parvulin-like peptidyl-prolyl isomerase